MRTLQQWVAFLVICFTAPHSPLGLDRARYYRPARPTAPKKQALRCMQRALRKASAAELRQSIQTHIEQTQVQIERVEQAMEKMSVRPGRKVCKAMRGLVEESPA
jgi:Domain of unknown function (DUF892)